MAKLKRVSLDELQRVARESFNSSEACRKLGLSGQGSSVTALKKLLLVKQIDISHWTGQLWSKGKTVFEDSRVGKGVSVEDIFCKESKASSSYVRKLILKKNLLPYHCSICGISASWNGKELQLQLDHISGDRHDHRIENLRWVCPNCHSQTDTFCGKNQRRKKVSDEEILEALRSSKNIRQVLMKVGLDNGRHYARVKKLIESTNDARLVELLDTSRSKRDA